jgi:hypothetical protein
MSEYNNTTVSGPSCSYATLTHYNNGSNMQVPLPAGGFAAGSIVPVPLKVIPGYGSSGYNTLLAPSKDKSCSGYFNIQSAYGRNSGSGCGQQYIRKLCQ